MTKIQQRLLAASILVAGMGFCFPLYQKLYRLYLASNREHIKADFELPKEVNNNSSKEQLPCLKKQPPRKIAENAEVIFVSGYEYAQDLTSGKVEVNIDRPDKNVLIVLNSYETINWEVIGSPTTNITGVLVSSYNPSTIINIDSTKVFPVDLPATDELENQNFVSALKQLNQWFGIDKVDVFRGQYSLPDQISVSELDPIDPALTLTGYPVQKATNNFEFTLYQDNYIPVKWTLKGASEPRSSTISQTGVAVSPDGTEIYELTQTGIKVTNQDGTQKEFELPGKFPELSWGTDIAYDSKRDLIALVSLGGEGHFYRFDVKKRRWLDARSVNNLDIQSLTYDRISDRYIAWAEDFSERGELLFISGTGELLAQEQVGNKMTGFYRHYDRGNEPAPVVEIAAQGNNIALIMRKNNEYGITISDHNPVQSIWHYDVNLKTARLTYKSN
ncbi:MAG: hypothetical protein AAGE84_04620 [Cyanobacteria bacterium P01_G01_bin.39]